jgi:hypothetical protein
MAALLWPLAVLAPKTPQIDIAPRSLAGPASVSGKAQVVSSDAGIWKASYSGFPVVDEQRVLAWRGISTLLEGRLRPILVPLWRRYQPVPAGAEDAGLYMPVPHDDGSSFGDDTEYQGGVIDVRTIADAPVRAVSLTVSVNVAGDIQPGQHFSIDERLYRVRSFDAGSGALTFRPPLREAVPAGTRLGFDTPVCRMRLASDDAMDLPLDFDRWGFPSVNFIEDV